MFRPDCMVLIVRTMVKTKNRSANRLLTNASHHTSQCDFVKRQCGSSAGE